MSTSVHPSAVIDPTVCLGTDVVIGPYAVIRGDVTIGDGVWIGPHAAIGTPAQMRGGNHEESAGLGVAIGSGTVVREFATVHQGTESRTIVGADCYLMAYAHVPHDAWIGNECTLSNSVQIGGHTWIDEGANLGLGAVVHQRCVIGAHSMVGMQAVVTRPVAPFTTVVGAPARVLGLNRRGLGRVGVEPPADDMGAGDMLESLTATGPLPEALSGYHERFHRAQDRARAREVR